MSEHTLVQAFQSHARFMHQVDRDVRLRDTPVDKWPQQYLRLRREYETFTQADWPESAKDRPLQLIGVTFKDCVFRESIRRVRFSQSVFLRCRFEDIELAEIVFDQCDLSGSRFLQCKSVALLQVSRSVVNEMVWSDVFAKGRLLVHHIGGRNAKFIDVKGGSEFHHARLVDSEFVRCAGLSLDETELRTVRLEQCQIKSAVLPKWYRVFVNGQSLQGVRFGSGGNTGGDWQGILDSDFRNADLRRSDLSYLDLAESDFSGADLSKANLKGASIRDAIFRECKGLYGRDRALLDDQRDEEWVQVRVGRFIPSWETISQARGMAIFGVSGVLVAGILGYMRFASWYNGLAEKADRSALEQRFVSILPGPVPIFDDLWLLLTATLFLAVGSLAFLILAPGIVKEYTEVRWTRELHSPRLEYLAASYRQPLARLAVVVAYAVGGALMLFVILQRIVVVYHGLVMDWLQ